MADHPANKPCPFCGKDLIQYPNWPYLFHPGVDADGDCIFSGRGIPGETLGLWNRRAPDPRDEMIEDLLGDIYRSGDWDDDHEELLTIWRAARGDQVKTDWRWWVGEVNGENYSQETDTREAAIEIGRTEYSSDGAFQIIEARLWNDSVKDVEDICAFAETRNHEIVQVTTDG